LHIAASHATQDGHESISASSGKEALVLLSEWRPDMVLLDVMMPDMNGYDTARAMRLVARTSTHCFLTGLNRPKTLLKDFMRWRRLSAQTHSL